jgi:hypothetical protein
VHWQLVHAEFHVVAPGTLLGMERELYLFGQIHHFLAALVSGIGHRRINFTRSKVDTSIAYQDIRTLKNLESARNA